MSKSMDKVSNFKILKSDNNLDGLDNLEEIPSENAVYAICGRVNGLPSNCRYVGETENLRTAIKQHFSDNEPDGCLRQFMQSIKIKCIDYMLLPNSDRDDRLKIVSQWRADYKPDCNEKLNEVF
ncbi:hypothetical protein D3C72_1517220 [compost metagenome]